MKPSERIKLRAESAQRARVSDRLAYHLDALYRIGMGLSIVAAVVWVVAFTCLIYKLS